MSGFLDMLAGESTPSQVALQPALPSRFERMTWSGPARDEGQGDELPFSSTIDGGDEVGKACPMAAIDGTRPPNVDVFVDADRQTATRQPFIDVSSPVVDPTPIQPHLASSASPSPSLKGSDRENDGMLRRIEEITQSLRMLKGRTEPVRIDSHLCARQPAGDTDQLPVSRLHPSTEAPFTSSPRELQAPPRIVPESLPLHSRAAIAPTVNVTIGRVEVKAGADRQPLPARREPVSRVMSLDQYLAGRAAGGRR